MSKELQDFPLESQQELSHTKVTISEREVGHGRETRLIVMQQVEEECMYVMLTQAQVIEIINLCRGRLIGNLTGLPLAFIAQHDQAMTYLRECLPSLDDIHRDGESMVIQMLDSHPAESIQMIHAMALITRLLLADQATSPAPPKS